MIHMFLRAKHVLHFVVIYQDDSEYAGITLLNLLFDLFCCFSPVFLQKLAGSDRSPFLNRHNFHPSPPAPPRGTAGSSAVGGVERLLLVTDLLRFRASVNTADVEGETALMEVTMLGDC